LTTLSFDFYANRSVKLTPGKSHKIYSFNNHPLLESCLASLVPYFDMNDIPRDIASLKITEAISRQDQEIGEKVIT